MTQRQIRSLLGLIVLAGAGIVGALQRDDAGTVAERSQPVFAPELDKAWVETFATVYRVLPDDTKGSQHQRFLVHSPDGHSLLIAHNIDLAPRVPIDEGSEVFIRGRDYRRPIRMSSQLANPWRPREIRQRICGRNHRW